MVKEDFTEMNLKIEAILFSYGDWVSIPEIMDVLNIDSETLVKNSLSELITKYKENYSFIIETDETGKYRMALKDEYEELVSSLITGTEIPRNVLKVLSVIAYEQPVTKTRLAEIIGRYVKQEVDYLFKAKFINYEKVGIAKYYRMWPVLRPFFVRFSNDKWKEPIIETTEIVTVPTPHN